MPPHTADTHVCATVYGHYVGVASAAFILQTDNFQHIQRSVLHNHRPAYAAPGFPPHVLGWPFPTFLQARQQLGRAIRVDHGGLA
jgi:hypothetical protein